MQAMLPLSMADRFVFDFCGRVPLGAGGLKKPALAICPLACQFVPTARDSCFVIDLMDTLRRGDGEVHLDLIGMVRPELLRGLAGLFLECPDECLDGTITAAIGNELVRQGQIFQEQ